MFDLLTTLQRTPSAGRHTSSYAGPERRLGTPSALWCWFAATLDEIDYGTLLLDADGIVQHVNHAARAELDADHPLQLFGRQLRARRATDAAPLQAALTGAAQRGLRKLLTLGESGRQTCVSVVPLPAISPDGRAATLVLLGRRQVCGELAVQGFARAHGLTAGETRVLAALCAGTGPSEIADRHGVMLSTVRTQIGSIRQKTGTDSIRDLVRQVAVLPPLMGALKAAGAPASPQRVADTDTVERHEALVSA